MSCTSLGVLHYSGCSNAADTLTFAKSAMISGMCDDLTMAAFKCYITLRVPQDPELHLLSMVWKDQTY